MRGIPKGDAVTKIDNDPKIRDLSRLLWEKAGRPSGREHVYWALASQVFQTDNKASDRSPRSVAR